MLGSLLVDTLEGVWVKARRPVKTGMGPACEEMGEWVGWLKHC